MTNEQQPAAPYSVDTLDVHDNAQPGARLVWAKEFGTNTTADVGDPYVTTAAAEPDVGIGINARLGMLQLNSTNNAAGFVEPRGSTFLIPSWDTFPESPIFFGLQVVMLFGHTIFQDGGEIGGPPRLDLIFGPDTLIGHAPAVPFALASLLGGVAAPDREPVSVSQWDTGGTGGPTFTTTGANWGSDIYWRALIFGDGVSQTDINLQVSGSGAGLSWTAVGSASLPVVLRRIGIGCGFQCIGAIDWMRLYTFVITSSVGVGLVPQFPVTGSRLYIP